MLRLFQYLEGQIRYWMRDRWSLTRWPTYSPRHSQFVLSVLHLRGRETATFALFLYRVRYFGPSSGDNSVFGNWCPLLAFTHSQITTKPILFLTLHNLKGETASFHSERVCVVCPRGAKAIAAIFRTIFPNKDARLSVGGTTNILSEMSFVSAS